MMNNRGMALVRRKIRGFLGSALGLIIICHGNGHAQYISQVKEEDQITAVMRTPLWRAFVDVVEKDFERPVERTTLEAACDRVVRYARLMDTKTLTDDCIKDALLKIDPSGVYIAPRQYRLLELNKSRPLAALGLGLQAAKPGDPLTVIEIAKNGPAAAGGVREGDVIMSIDGVKLAYLKNYEVFNLLRGEPGSVARIEAVRGGQPLSFELRREKIPSNTAHSALLDVQTLYIRLSRFQSQATARELLAGLKTSLTPAISSPNRIIVDLRDNPGGSLPEVVSVASLFVPKDTVVAQIKYRHATESLRTTATPEIDLPGSNKNILRSLPITVLVNAGTSSGSNVLARMLRTARDAKVVAQFETGTEDYVLQNRSLRDLAAVNLTIGRLLTSFGEPWGGRGVPVDIVLDFPGPEEVDYGSLPGDTLLQMTLNRLAQ